MQILKLIYLTLAFLLELVMFFSISYWGYHQGKSTFTKWAIAIVCLSITITLWGIFAAPKSEMRLEFHSRLVFELVMFLLGALALYKMNFTTQSVVMAVLSILAVIVAFVFKQ